MRNPRGPRCDGLLLSVIPNERKATGQDALGRAVKQGAVLYAALEERLANVQAPFRAMGATGQEPIHITVGKTPQDAVAALRTTMLDILPVLVVIDPVILMARIKDASAYAETYAALAPLIELAREAEAHLLLLHHAAKLERSGIDAPLGSTAFGGAKDAFSGAESLYSCMEDRAHTGIQQSEAPPFRAGNDVETPEGLARFLGMEDGFARVIMYGTFEERLFTPQQLQEPS